mmetsp:Transcript_175/g.301  ORF Transcript_175/g.301 Transcript_175/m.301 type:complete len:158 (-) Transcript_175:7-480(-)
MRKDKLRELIEAQQRGGLVSGGGRTHHSGGGDAPHRLRLVSGSGALDAKKVPPPVRKAQKSPSPSWSQGSDETARLSSRGRSKPAAGYLYQDEESLPDEEKTAMKVEEQRQRERNAEFERNKKSILRLRSDRAKAQQIREAQRRRAESGHNSFEFLS